MPLSILVIALDLFCIVHIIRSGGDRIWLYVVVLLPGLGSLAYLATEILPGLLRGRHARRAARGALDRIDPERVLRRRAADLELIETADTKRLMAEEYVRLGRFAEATTFYEKALSGIHQDDPALLLGLARAQSGLGRHDGTLGALDRLRAAHPHFQSAEAHMLYAKSLEGLGRDTEALDELAVLATYAPGEEARCRYALLLVKVGRTAEARQLFGEILARANRADGRYRRNEREWIETARRSMA